MGQAYITSGTFNHAVVTMCFIVATLYGFNFYYTSYDYATFDDPQLSDDSFWSILWRSTFDSGLELLSVLNPFVLVKIFLYDQLDFETFWALNLFILRPIGWVVLFMESEWIINKVRGISG